MWKGDYFPFTVTVKDNAGVALNLTGYTARAQIRNPNDATQVWDFTANIPTPSNGEVQLTLTSPVSSTIPAGNYIWDFQVTDPSGNVRTYIAGDVRVYDEVTR